MEEDCFDGALTFLTGALRFGALRMGAAPLAGAARAGATLELLLEVSLTPGKPFTPCNPSEVLELVKDGKGFLDDAIAVLKALGAWLVTKALAVGARAQRARILT
jgi:hypothetical protein